MNLREHILQHLKRHDYVPETVPVLAAKLGVARRDRRKLAHELRLLESEGAIVRVKKDRYCIPADADLVTGKLIFRQSGAALLIPEVPPGQPEREPIEIAAEDTGVAMHGDRVVVQLSKHVFKRMVRGPFRDGPDRRRTGRVVRILERARTTVTGNLQRSRLFWLVEPDDPRIVHDIYVADPATTTIRPVPAVGDKVLVRLHEWTQRHLNPEGEILEVLGRTHEPQAELKAILHKYNLEPNFPEAVLREVEAIPQEVGPAERRGRLDIRHIPTITIDPDDAKDFDDALSLEELPGGELRVGIHIADVPAYVRPGTALDAEAQKRGNSTYLVGVVVPMLPHALSNGVCSLKEGVDRLTKSVFLTFTRAGKLRETTCANTVIRSIKRMTYKQAYVLLKDDDPKAIRKLPPPPAHQTGFAGRPFSELAHKEIEQLRAIVRTLWSIASRLRRDRMRHGSLDLEMPETKIYVDAQGYADRLEKVEHDESHQLIEEFMLAANEAVARLLREAGLPALYRVHDEPDEDRLLELQEFLGTFGVQCGDLTQRAELNRLLETLRHHPQGHLLRTQVLRSLKKACYRGTPDGHFGLFKRDYLHFTSPIRRYADLVVHRVFVHYLARFHGQPLVPGAKVDYAAAKIASLGEHVSTTETNSAEAERESVKVKLLEFFEREGRKKKKTRFEAVITETRNHGMFIELTESMAFGLVHMSTLDDDLYYVSDDGTALVGRRTKNRYTVGDRVEVAVHRVDRYKRQIDFKIVGRVNGSAAATASAPARGLQPAPAPADARARGPREEAIFRPARLRERDRKQREQQQDKTSRTDGRSDRIDPAELHRRGRIREERKFRQGQQHQRRRRR
ncbi:MAG: RNB domain-containing ribonuclease [Opitutaceae bacterium]|nr:RNB domain-containing ribonuclease [Opitutaceae bacterium]